MWAMRFGEAWCFKRKKKGGHPGVWLREAKDRVIVAWDLKTKNMREKCKRNGVWIRKIWVWFGHRIFRPPVSK